MNEDAKQMSKPSILKIVRTDYTALVALVLPIIGWLFYLVTSLLGLQPENAAASGNIQLSLAIVGIITAVGLVVLVRRILLIRRVFAQGVTISGKITAVAFTGSRGQVSYRYKLQRKKYEGNSTFFKTKGLETLKPNDKVTLIVDENTPTQAFVRSFYL